MKIVYAVGGYKPAYPLGGPVLSVSAAAEALARRGHQVTVVTTNADFEGDVDVPLERPVDVDGVTVWYFRRREPLRSLIPIAPYLSGSIGYLYAPRMREELDRLVPQADLVDVQSPFVYPGYAAARAALRHGKPLFYHQRGSFLARHLLRRRRKKQLFLELFEKPVIRRATTLIALTEAERHAFHALGTETPCEVIPNGVHLPGPPNGAAGHAYSRWGIPPGATVILFLGRLESWKGAEELLEAFAAVQRERPDAYLVMAGSDHDHYSRHWLARAGADGFGGRVVFTGFLTGAEKTDALERADLFCLPSEGEGLSMAMLEALAHRTAVMLSPGCNFPDAEAVGAGVTVEKQVAPMAAALRRLLADPGKLRRMGTAGRRLVEEKYSWETVADRLIEVYERAVAN